MATVTTARPTRRSHRPRIGPGRFLAWTIMILALALTIFPFYWMIRTSLSTSRSLNSDPGSLLPVDFTLGAFKRVFGLATVAEAQAEGGSGAAINFWVYLKNSVMYSSLVTFGQVFFSALAAYAFSRLHWKGRDKVFLLFLTALMVPPIFTSLPNFVLIKNLGLLDTYAGLVLPTFFMTPFAIFFLRQFFLGIPREMEEAARMDGAGHVRIFLRIIIPMSWAPITTLVILTYVAAWNDYFWPLLVGTSDNSKVLTVALGVFKSQTPQGGPDWAGLMAATLVAAAPMLLLLVVFGRKVVNSIGFSGLK
jgi:multiple sugar transport system permease protein